MEKTVEQMSLREKIGQCFSVGFPGTELTEEYSDFLKEFQVGNLILFGENIESGEQLSELCSTLRQQVLENTQIAPFIMIDQEGGAIVRLSDDLVNVPGAMATAASQNPENAYAAGQLTGRQLRRLGINFDLAPVMDINCNRNNPVIGIRSYGDEPGQVGTYAMKMAKGLISEKVLACAKHFPGHGDTAQDSHLSLPIVDKPMEQLEKTELRPFREAVDMGIPAVMSAHILFPALEPEKIPATMSEKILTGLLRKTYGFQGIILSDCMEMGAIKKYYGTANGVVKALGAGVNIVLISHTPSAAKEAIEAVEKAVGEGALLEEVIDASVKRILALKKVYAEKEDRDGRLVLEEDKQKAYRLLKETITPVTMPFGKTPKAGENPFFAGCYAYRITLAANMENKTLSFPEWMERKLGGTSCIFSPNPQEEEICRIVEKAKGHSSIVIGTYNGHLQKGQIKLIERLSKLDTPVTVFALRNPYDLKDLPQNVTAIVMWEYSVRSFQAALEILKGEWMPKGQMPIRW
ncbi:beta-N-acetylhexosaminidase [Parablautia muri]|uniref:Beta-N-acetylhexosaminidase n=1 Tax=Parablautia muri TaxID=2320879 RepID=A0A9X5BD48_9FIRM|nr:beta-N-acetylhexosaminidase [Parablautia muri]NBJ91566.1 beta-N-acetylhexosaminidase [Parablautia muri]